MINRTGAKTPVVWHELALLVCLAILWGSSYMLTRIAVTDIPPVTLIAIRVTIATFCLLVVVGFRRLSLPRDGKTWWLLLVQAFLNSIGAWTLLAWGQQYIDSGLASVLNSTSPIFVFLITCFVTRHEVTSGLKLAGACIGVLGVVLIVGPDVLKGLGQQVAGQAAAIAGAVLYAAAAIFGKRFTALAPAVTAAGTMLWATLLLVPASLIIDQPWRLSPSPAALTAAVVLGSFCTALAFLIYFRLINTLGSMGVASQAYLRAGVGVLLGVTVLGEQVTPVVALGLVAALVGVALINMPARRQTLIVE